MPMGCCAFGCRNYNIPGGGKTFHRLPADPALRQQWVLRISRADWSPAKTSVLCSDHFTADCFIHPAVPGFYTRCRLKPDAVPTVFHFEEMPQNRRSRKRYADINWLDEVCVTTSVFCHFSIVPGKYPFRFKS